MQPPLVSVVVCFLNEEVHLAEALDSVLAQTLADWELLLVDDGSTDASTAIAQRLAAERSGKVTYIEHPQHRNLGLSASRNAGIARARGRYVAFLDADDVWYPHKLEQQVALLEAHPEAAMVLGASQYWRSWDAAATRPDEVVPVGAPADALAAPPSLMSALYPLGDGAAPPPSDILLRYEVVEAVGGFEASFRGPLMMYEDQAFLSKIYRHYPVYVSSACFDRYRERSTSIVATNLAAGRYWQVRAHFLTWLHRDLERTGGTPPAVSPLLARASRQATTKLLRARVGQAVRACLPRAVYRWLRPLSGRPTP